MANKELYAVISTDNENFGIDSKISVFRNKVNADTELLEMTIKLLNSKKIKEKKFENNGFEIFDEDNNQYTGKIEKFMIADNPELEAGPYPFTMDLIRCCLSQQAFTTTILNNVFVNETAFERDEEIKGLEKYIRELEESLMYARNAQRAIKKRNDIIWLSIDETANELDMAFFYNKSTAISYLSCRFEQALKKMGFHNDTNTSAEDKAKYYAEKEKFAKYHKMMFELEGDNCTSYGKIICLEIDEIINKKEDK